MTNKAALIAVLRISVPDDTVEKALLDNDINGGSTYAKTMAESIDMCAVDIFRGLLTEPDVSEGGYSVKYDRSAIQARIDDLLLKWEKVEEAKPTISNGSNWW